MADFYSAANGDDLKVQVDTGLADNDTLTIGDAGGTPYYDSYIRFRNVTIPNGATILSAKVTLYAEGNYSNTTCNTNIYLNDEDSATVPVDISAYNALALTDAVAWNSVASITTNVACDTPDITTIMQAIIDREGWVSGNDVAVLIKNNSSSNNASRTFRSYNQGNAAYYPTLAITYTASGSTTSTFDSTLPIFSLVNCYVEVPHSGFDESLPMLTISATAIQSTVIAGDCTLPVLTLSGTSGFQTTSEFEETLPSLTASASSLTGEIHEGDCDVPFFTISASLLNGGISQGVASLPFFIFSGRTINTGTVSESFPIFTINAYAHGPLLHTLNETLPLLQVVASLVHASTAFRCYVLNTENSAITEYDNFPFNSFCTFKGKHLAAGSNGIMLLEGNKDLSTDINAYFNIGSNDFDLPNIKRITDAYLSMKGDGFYYLTVTSDDGVAHSYLLSATAGDRIKNLKTNVGKGKKGRFFELELSNLAGADFELYDMVLNVELLKRNI